MNTTNTTNKQILPINQKMQNSRIIGLLICLLGYWVIGLSSPVFAQTASPLPTSPPSSGQAGQATPSAKPITPTQNHKISDLKERIASKVAELNLVEKRGFLGQIASISATRIVLTDLQDRTRIIDTDELTKSSKTGDFSPSSFGDGDTIAAFGIYNKNSRVLLARFLDTQRILKRVFGEVTVRSDRDFSFSVKDDKGQKHEISFEKTTIANVWENGKLTKIGFSKIKTGQRIFVVALESGEAMRLTTFPGLATEQSNNSTISAIHDSNVR